MSSEKTEKPSAKRLKEAREKGNIPRSRELALAVASVTSTIVFVSFGQTMLRRMLAAVAEGIARIGRSPVTELKGDELTGMIVSGGWLLLLVVGPIAIAAALTSVGAFVVQGGFNFAPAALTPDFGRLSPAKGIQRLAPKQSWIDTGKALISCTVIAVIVWNISRNLALDSARLPWMTPLGAAGRSWAGVSSLLWQGSFAMLALGAADYGLQYWRNMSGLKMSKQELRDEAKGSEGNPEVKGRVRRIQRDMVRKRMLNAAKTATVVITNPTHFAVALEYNREKSPAPIVVAKGQDLIALKIRQIAREHSVPIIENPPLARALYKGADVGDTIPADLFGAVAEVLAYLIRIKQLML
jgi:flagellar biosynthetic protein FlhB